MLHFCNLTASQIFTLCYTKIPVSGFVSSTLQIIQFSYVQKIIVWQFHARNQFVHKSEMKINTDHRNIWYLSAIEKEIGFDTHIQTQHKKFDFFVVKNFIHKIFHNKSLVNLFRPRGATVTTFLPFCFTIHFAKSLWHEKFDRSA